VVQAVRVVVALALVRVPGQRAEAMARFRAVTLGQPWAAHPAAIRRRTPSRPFKG